MFFLGTKTALILPPINLGPPQEIQGNRSIREVEPTISIEMATICVTPLQLKSRLWA